jgi:hypothetical protein
MMSGLTGLSGLGASTGLAVALFLALAVLAAVVYLTTWRQRSRLDWFVLVASVLVLLGMFSSSEFYDHYAYFPAAFLSLLLAICMAQALAWLRRLMRHRVFDHRRNVLRLVPPVVVAAVVVVAALLVHEDATYASSNLSGSADPAAEVDAQIPEGSCVTYDYSIYGINADRFNPSGAGCPAVVDPFGMWLTRNDGQPPPAPPPFPAAFTAAWQGWLNSSEYVVLSVPYSDYIPWTTQLEASFGKNFILLSSDFRVYIYSHTDRVLLAPGNR